MVPRMAFQASAVSVRSHSVRQEFCQLFAWEVGLDPEGQNGHHPPFPVMLPLHSMPVIWLQPHSCHLPALLCCPYPWKVHQAQPQSSFFNVFRGVFLVRMQTKIWAWGLGCRVPSHSECAHLLIYMPLSLQHPECTRFLGTATVFSFCSCTAPNTSWSPAQDHSHQKRVISNPEKPYQTFCLQTKCLKLERRGFAIISSTENLLFLWENCLQWRKVTWRHWEVSPFSSCWQIIICQHLDFETNYSFRSFQ